MAGKVLPLPGFSARIPTGSPSPGPAFRCPSADNSGPVPCIGLVPGQESCVSAGPGPQLGSLGHTCLSCHLPLAPYSHPQASPQLHLDPGPELPLFPCPSTAGLHRPASLLVPPITSPCSGHDNLDRSILPVPSRTPPPGSSPALTDPRGPLPSDPSLPTVPPHPLCSACHSLHLRALARAVPAAPDAVPSPSRSHILMCLGLDVPPPPSQLP